MSKNDGGQAFPSPYQMDEVRGFKLEAQTGMSLRDYFAALAMQGIISKTPFVRTPSVKRADIITTYAARAAYDYADAMLKERTK